MNTKLTHSDLIKWAVEYLRSKGHYAWSNKTSGTFDPVRKIYRRNTTYRGSADVLGTLKNGTHIEVEIKVGRDTLRPDQINHKAEIMRRGAIYIVCRSPEDLLNDERL